MSSAGSLGDRRRRTLTDETNRCREHDRGEQAGEDHPGDSSVRPIELDVAAAQTGGKLVRARHGVSLSLSTALVTERADEVPLPHLRATADVPLLREHVELLARAVLQAAPARPPRALLSAACRPRSLRVAAGRLAIVRFFLAALCAFTMFCFAARACFRVAIVLLRPSPDAPPGRRYALAATCTPAPAGSGLRQRQERGRRASCELKRELSFGLVTTPVRLLRHRRREGRALPAGREDGTGSASQSASSRRRRRSRSSGCCARRRGERAPQTSNSPGLLK